MENRRQLSKEERRVYDNEVRRDGALQRHKDNIGKRFGSLIVLEVNADCPKPFEYICKCDCGATDKFYSSNIVTKRQRFCRACGERRKRGWSHGKSGTPTYSAWHNIVRRCIRDKPFIVQGIKICERWKSYINFLSDMGERPEGCEINRLNPAGDFSPENCIWSPKGELRRSQIGLCRLLHSKSKKAVT